VRRRSCFGLDRTKHLSSAERCPRTHADVVVDYALCSTESQLGSALEMMWRSEWLVLDCEGRTLGLHGGALSLLSIGTAQGAVFLVDVLAIPRESPAAHDLATLLSCIYIPKIVWDGRMDAIALRETCGIILRGVLDLQLAEVVSRMQARGETDETRLARLVSVVGHHALWAREHYQDVHVLAGLDACLRRFGVGLEHIKSGV
jgi:exonuclease 3'-5' domain-containing protein 1